MKHALKLWAKKWLLWHMACPVHGREFTEKRGDPDCSWDAGLLTYCNACEMSCIDVKVWMESKVWA